MQQNLQQIILSITISQILVTCLLAKLSLVKVMSVMDDRGML